MGQQFWDNDYNKRSIRETTKGLYRDLQGGNVMLAFVAGLILFIFLMPLIGLILCFSKDYFWKAIGYILFCVGLMIFMGLGIL